MTGHQPEPRQEHLTLPKFLVGTASWTERTLVESDTFYPPSIKTAEERLRFYADHFKTVEVDSTYYALPSERNAKLWVERTPNDFIFNVKAFAMLTQHAAETNRLPNAIKELLIPEQLTKSRLERPGKEVLDLAFRMFHSALAPLRDASKLGMLLFQFPPYFVRSARNFDYIAGLGQRLPGMPLAIEFRHPSWVAEGEARLATMKFLREHRLAYVSVDEPQLRSTIPSFLDVTTEDAYIRFHGRNSENWFRRDIEVAERYKYLYSEGELADWTDRLRKVKGAKRAFVIFNNCYRNFGIMNATTMQQMLSH
jgi:uncharacterized protein YecE (DUF72 family)